MFSTRPLLVSTHWEIETGVREKILLVRRTANGYTSLNELRSSFEDVKRVVDPLDRSTMSLLADLRLAPPRDDPEFERVALEQPKYLAPGFQRAAVVLRLAIGLLQVQRHMQQMGLPIRVFNDEQQALDYLRGRLVDPVSNRRALPVSRRGPA